MSFLHCRSGKQKLCATASTDAEIIAAVEAVKFMIWMRNLIAELQLVSMHDMELMQDNMSSIKMHTEQTKTKRTKHLLTRVQFIKSYVKSDALRITWVATKLITADVLTKPLQGVDFFAHVTTLMGYSHEKFFD
jgi:hypothetical protein